MWRRKGYRSSIAMFMRVCGWIRTFIPWFLYLPLLCSYQAVNALWGPLEPWLWMAFGPGRMSNSIARHFSGYYRARSKKKKNEYISNSLYYVCSSLLFLTTITFWKRIDRYDGFESAWARSVRPASRFRRNCYTLYTVCVWTTDPMAKDWKKEGRKKRD